jgi:phosphopantothenoylcysteine decarboxylase/phosphopantothenate--cysteine ligase
MNVILGVTGCIAAYKAPVILRLLQKEGITIHSVMTRSATRFIGPLTLEKLSGNRVICDMFESPGAEIEHISLARRSALLLVAPATANVIAKFAAGIADDFLSTIYLSTTTPVVVAPAMNVEMWRHAATQRNLETLRQRGVLVVEPEVGYQACGEVGEGRLSEPESIVAMVMGLLRRQGSLLGKKILVTAGPTVEDIDPVRYVSNRSSGKMGFAIAGEAAKRGGEVSLVAGPVSLPDPQGVTVLRVRSADEMQAEVMGRFGSADVVVKAAAVADFRPDNKLFQKRKKSGEPWNLNLVPTVDILASLGKLKRRQFLVGFAAESENLVENATRKLHEKKLDFIVANDISSTDSGFDTDYNRVVFIGADGTVTWTERVPKAEVARLLWDQVELQMQELRHVTASGLADDAG